MTYWKVGSKVIPVIRSFSLVWFLICIMEWLGKGRKSTMHVQHCLTSAVLAWTENFWAPF